MGLRGLFGRERINRCIGLLRFIPDETYLKIMFRLRTGNKLNLVSPRTYDEKLQYLKLHDRKKIYTTIVDKYAVKEYVAERIGHQYIIPTLGVWDRFDDIDFDALPDQFVLKCTHDSGGLVICPDKKTLDLDRAKRVISQSLKTNFYYVGREWPYKDVKPRIIAEKYMKQQEGIPDLIDYKFFCFDGKPVYIMTVRGGHGTNSKTLRRLYDTNWVKQDIGLHGGSNVIETEEKPKTFEMMLRLSETLSKGFKHIRVDLYEIDGAIFFGELTFFHQSGFETFDPAEWNLRLGELIKI